MPRKLTVTPAAAEALADKILNNNSSIPYAVRIPAISACRLDEAAQKRGISVSGFIRYAVEAVLNSEPAVKKELHLAEVHERAHAVAALVRGQHIENLKIDGENSFSSIGYTSKASEDDRIIIGLAGIVAEFQVTGRQLDDLFEALIESSGCRPILSDADAAAVAGWERLHLEAAWDIVARWLPIIE